MLAFWGNNEALTAADCTNLSKRSRYSNREVSNSNIIWLYDSKTH